MRALIVIASVLATIIGVVGAGVLSLSGVVWSATGLAKARWWDEESGFGVGVAIAFFVLCASIWVVSLLLGLFVVPQQRRRHLRLWAVATVVSVILVGAVSGILLIPPAT